MMEAKSVRNMYSIIAVTNKHTAKLHQVGSLFISEIILNGDRSLLISQSHTCFIFVFHFHEYMYLFVCFNSPSLNFSRFLLFFCPLHDHEGCNFFTVKFTVYNLLPFHYCIIPYIDNPIQRNIYNFLWRNIHNGAQAASLLRFLDHTHLDTHTY